MKFGNKLLEHRVKKIIFILKLCVKVFKRVSRFHKNYAHHSRYFQLANVSFMYLSHYSL